MENQTLVEYAISTVISLVKSRILLDEDHYKLLQHTEIVRIYKNIGENFVIEKQNVVFRLRCTENIAECALVPWLVDFELILGTGPISIKFSLAFA